MSRSAPQRPPIRAAPAHLHVELLLYPEAMAGTVLGLIDLFHTANMLARVRRADAPPLVSWRLLGPDAQPLGTPPNGLANSFLRDSPAPPPERRHAALSHACFVPPMHAHNVPGLRDIAARWPALSRHLASAWDAGRTLVTMGSSAWFAARSGRLGGRRMAVPWFCLGGFRSDFPDIVVADAQAISADLPLLSATGSEALVALGLRLLEPVAGAELAQSFENALRHNDQRQRMTLQAAQQAHIPNTRDSVLARAIDWLQQHLDQPYRLDALASAAATSPRTLLRHFQQVLGMTPLEHLHRLRCQRARILLEITLDSVPTIAQACGYADPAAFRRIFARCEGMTPSQYRERYALRSSRARWKVEDPRLFAL